MLKLLLLDFFACLIQPLGESSSQRSSLDEYLLMLVPFLFFSLSFRAHRNLRWFLFNGSNIPIKSHHQNGKSRGPSPSSSSASLSLSLPLSLSLSLSLRYFCLTGDSTRSECEEDKKVLGTLIPFLNKDMLLLILPKMKIELSNKMTLNTVYGNKERTRREKNSRR